MYVPAWNRSERRGAGWLVSELIGDYQDIKSYGAKTFWSNQSLVDLSHEEHLSRKTF